MTNEVKKRQRKPKSEFQKQLEKARKNSPSHVVEIELVGLIIDFKLV